LPVLLYGCETWSLALGEEHNLRVLRRMFGSKRDDVKGKWRRLHNEELYDMYSQNIIRIIKSRRLRWAEYGARKGKTRVRA
jgi:hypothetical protein